MAAKDDHFSQSRMADDVRIPDPVSVKPGQPMLPKNFAGLNGFIAAVQSKGDTFITQPSMDQGNEFVVLTNLNSDGVFTMTRLDDDNFMIKHNPGK